MAWLGCYVDAAQAGCEGLVDKIGGSLAFPVCMMSSLASSEEHWDVEGLSESGEAYHAQPYRKGGIFEVTGDFDGLRSMPSKSALRAGFITSS